MSPSKESSTLAMLVDDRNSWYDQPCEIYLYETIMPGIYKYGISKDHALRAKTCKPKERGRYAKFIYAFPGITRRTALVVEELIRQAIADNQDWSLGSLCCESKHVADLIGISYEYTRMTPDEFWALARKHLEGLSTMGRVDYLTSIRPMPSDVASVIDWVSRIHSRRLCLLDSSGYPDLDYGKDTKNILLYLCEEDLFSPGRLYKWGKYRLPAISWEVVLAAFRVPNESEPDWISLAWDSVLS